MHQEKVGKVDIVVLLDELFHIQLITLAPISIVGEEIQQCRIALYLFEKILIHLYQHQSGYQCIERDTILNILIHLIHVLPSKN